MRVSSRLAGGLLAGCVLALAGLAAGPSAHAAGLPPVYIHTDGANDFLESIVAVRPGQAIEFVNEDTGGHTVVGYEPFKGGAKIKGFKGFVLGTKGPGHKISSYSIKFSHTGVYPYYCSVHAELVKVYNHGGDHYVAAVKRPKKNGYGGPMSGVIIVTNDPHILAITPPTAHERILKDYFGG
jgi:plastocyanin